MFGIHTGKTLYTAKITSFTVFVTCVQDFTKVMFGITIRLGKVFRVQMNGQALVHYNVSNLRDNDLAIKIARCLSFTDAEDLYTAEFERLLIDKELLAVVKLVASSDMVLQTPAIIVRFQKIPVEPNSPQTIFQYLSTLLEIERLNERENIDLATTVYNRTFIN